MTHRNVIVCVAVFLAAAFARPAICADDTPKGVDALLTDARHALANRDAGLALELADKAIAADGESVKARTFRAGLLDAMGKLEESLADYDKLVALQPKDAQTYQRRGIARFKLGRFKESVADFDKELEIRPANAPYHWQRGIALYYAGDFEGGRKQFELHKTVNPADVENAAWHFLCVARLGGAEQAKKVLIPVVGDERIPMAKVHDLFAATATEGDVIRAAMAGNPDPDDLKDRLFYAHLYIGLYDEATGNAAGAKEHIGLAAEKYKQDHYMGWVARVHAKVLENPPESAPRK